MIKRIRQHFAPCSDSEIVLGLFLVTIKVGFVILGLVALFNPKAREVFEAIRPAPTGLNQWGE